MHKILKPIIYLAAVVLFYTKELAVMGRRFVHIEVKFNLNTFIGIGLLIVAYMIFAGKIDAFRDFSDALHSVAPFSRAAEGYGAIIMMMFVGPLLIMLARGPFVMLGYMLVALAWLILVSFETPPPVDTKNARIDRNDTHHIPSANRRSLLCPLYRSLT
jgi:hypothetical protein